MSWTVDSTRYIFHAISAESSSSYVNSKYCRRDTWMELAHVIMFCYVTVRLLIKSRNDIGTTTTTTTTTTALLLPLLLLLLLLLTSNQFNNHI
jgi:hypothetical protein